MDSTKLTLAVLTGTLTLLGQGGLICSWKGTRTLQADDPGIVLDWEKSPVGAVTVCVEYRQWRRDADLRGLVAFKGAYVDKGQAVKGWHPGVAIQPDGRTQGLWADGPWDDPAQHCGMFSPDEGDGFFAVRYDPAGEGTTVLRRCEDGRWRHVYGGRGLKASVEARGTATCGILGANIGGGVVPGVKPLRGMCVVRAEAFADVMDSLALECWAFPATVATPRIAGPDEPKRVLELTPGPGNSRNSEGSFIKLRDGRILMIYSRYLGKGGGDDDPAVLAQCESRDGGRTWSTNSVDIIRNEGTGNNVMSVSLLRLANGEIALFYLRKNAWCDCFPVVRFSWDEAKTWSAPVKCIDQTSKAGFCVLNNDRVIQLPCGRILLPIARHCITDRGPDMMGQIFCLYSDDNGRTWKKTEPEFKAYEADGKRIKLQEPGVVALKDGRVMMWIRTDGGRELACYSSDLGETWSKPEKTDIHCPCAPVSIKRLRNGDLLMAWNDHRGHPELKPLHVYHAGTRSPLTLAISKDDGRTWQKRKVLEGNVYDGGWYCYTAMLEEGDAVLLEYCCMKHLCHSRITRVPLKWIYGPDPSSDPTTLDGYFDD